jgi:hypothetical protein
MGETEGAVLVCQQARHRPSVALELVWSKKLSDQNVPELIHGSRIFTAANGYIHRHMSYVVFELFVGMETCLPRDVGLLKLLDYRHRRPKMP